jgi:flagellar protein FlaG
MPTIDSNVAIQARALPHAEVSSQQKPAQSADTVIKEIRAVSAKSEQVNASIAEKRSAAAEQRGKIQAKLEEAIQTLNESVELNPNKLQFTVDSVSNKIMIVVTDEVTGETVRQVPAEALLRVAHNLEAMKGILFDKVL